MPWLWGVFENRLPYMSVISSSDVCSNPFVNSQEFSSPTERMSNAAVRRVYGKDALARGLTETEDGSAVYFARAIGQNAVVSQSPVSIIPNPPPRPTIENVHTPIAPTGAPTVNPPGPDTFNYTVASGATLYARDQELLFVRPSYSPSPGSSPWPAYWNMTNNGTLWLANFAETSEYGQRWLIQNVANFTNNGLIVVETVGDIEFGAQINLISANESQLQSFVNNGSIYVINDTVGGTTPGFVGTSYAFGLRVSSIDSTITNNGLFAVRADGGAAYAISSVNEAAIVNTANGRVLAEGEQASAITLGFHGTVDNYGLVQAAVTRPELGPAFGVRSDLSGRFTNHAGGRVIADIAVAGFTEVINHGELRGQVYAWSDVFMNLTNSATGVINGNVWLSNHVDTVVNAGTINGNLFAYIGNDHITNSGTITGIVDLGLGDDTYIGSAGRDLVAGDNGADNLSGNGGNDLLIGGNGNDTLDGGAGNDGLFGEADNDTIITRGGDYVHGGKGDDVVRLGDYTFAFATGGVGYDRLVLASGARALDLSAVLASGRLESFEQIDLVGQQRLVVRGSDVSTLTGSLNQLTVATTSSDTVQLVGQWVAGNNVTVNGVVYRSYTLSGGEVLVGGSGTVSVVASASPGATGLDAIAGGQAAPMPGVATGLYLTPDELFVRNLELREDTTIEPDELWFTTGSAPALYSYVDGVDLTVNGTLLALNETGAASVGASFINRTSIEVNGTVRALTTGPQSSPTPAYFPSANNGAIAITSAFNVTNNGLIEALSERGMASGIGWARFALMDDDPNGDPDQGIDDYFEIGDGVNQLFNHGDIYAYSAQRQAFGATGGYIFNASGSTIEAVGRIVAAGAVTIGDLENRGIISASLTPDGYGRSYGIVVLDGDGYVISNPERGNQTIVNSGIVQAEFALVATNFRSDSGQLIINNSGELRGNVVTGHGIDRITNTGIITGYVELGGQNDLFDGRDGIQLGPIYGQGGRDTLRGGREADILVGGAGNDTLDGGGNVDIAIVSGNRSQYNVSQTSTGVWRVHGPDGTDTLTAIEYLQFDDQIMRLRPGTGVSVNFSSGDPASYQSAMNNIRDFDGNALGGDGSWLRIGSADVNGDGDLDQILVNRAIGRFATVGTAPDGMTYFSDFSWAGETRVAGIYIDPLVLSGHVIQGSDHDSQRRFQNDLGIGNINRVLGADDFDGDGIWEVYFALTDGTAFLRALMHADGNINYANYQSEEQVIDYLTANGYDESTFGDWFSGNTTASETETYINKSIKEPMFAPLDQPEAIHFLPLDEFQPEFFG